MRSSLIHTTKNDVSFKSNIKIYYYWPPIFDPISLKRTSAFWISSQC